MFYTNEGSPKRIVEIIESVDGALLFNSKEKLEKVMGSINFKDGLANNPNLRLSRPIGQIRSLYTGVIYNQTVYLEFSQNDGSKDIKLLAKRYVRLGGCFINGIKHRDSDLPAYIQYFSNTGEVSCLFYYKDNKQKRGNNKPVAVSHYELDDGNKYLRYYEEYDYSAENFSIYSVDLLEQKIVDASFCYNNNLVKLSEIIEIIPEFKELKLTELENLKSSNLISDELSFLLDMKKI